MRVMPHIQLCMRAYNVEGEACSPPDVGEATSLHGTNVPEELQCYQRSLHCPRIGVEFTNKRTCIVS